MGGTRLWRSLLRIGLILTLVGAVVLLGVACGEEEVTPTPTPAETLTPTPTPDLAAEGRQQYIAKGCASCHGQNAEGTDIAPALPGHNEEEVKRQVRFPMGNMPSSDSESISDDELELIAHYIQSLEYAEEHYEPMATEDTLAIHHWMALYATDSNNADEAAHHVRHIIGLLTDTQHIAQMEEGLVALQEGEFHEASHDIENMLVGTADPGLDSKNLHLRMALAAFGADDLEDASHHIRDFITLATGDEKERGEEALDLLEQGNIHDAQHEVEELLGEDESHE